MRNKRGSSKNSAMKMNRYSAYAWLGVLIAFLVALTFDLNISKLVVGLGNPLLTTLMIWVTYLSTPIIAILSTLIVYSMDRKRLFALWTSLIATLGLVVLIKVFVGRFRPVQLGFFPANAPLSLIKESYSQWDFSFPSSHAAVAIAVLPFMPKKWRMPWIVFSAVVIFSRVYFGLHYLSDVIAGAALGYIVSSVIKAKMPSTSK